MATPIEEQASLSIGTVESLSPDEITILLDLEAPQATALNTGLPTPFPRINGYVLIPNVDGSIVGIITWVGVERASFPKRKGLKDFGLIDLPYPLRKMKITPIGTLRCELDQKYCLERGVEVFPSVGDPVLLPTPKQLSYIVKSDAPVKIGIAPLAEDAEVRVDPDKIFGRHLAVLGNTGSGKSCSVAGLIRWSLEAAKKESAASPNARFIILDPNGEYKDAFLDLGNVRVFQVDPKDQNHRPLTVPAWMWNSEEWTSFARAAPGTQRPLLLETLRKMRAGEGLPNLKIRKLIRLLGTALRGTKMWRNYPPLAMEFLQLLECGDLLDKFAIELNHYIGSDEISTEISNNLQKIKDKTEDILEKRRPLYKGKVTYNKYIEDDFNELISPIEEVLDLLPQPSQFIGETADSPIPFDVEGLPESLEQTASSQTRSGMEQFISFLVMRIQMMLADTRLKPIVAPIQKIELDKWLEDYIGKSSARNGQIVIIDLSLVRRDVIHIVISVIARLVFEALQRYSKLNDRLLPTVLVLEEAHTFVHKGREEETIPTPEQMCRQTFERIAREGRKFGLGLVLSSQRPFELSPTALAQCNTFLLHRIVNDKDQELVGKLVPDALGKLLKELPTLPTQRAILLGWATPVPVLVRMRYLPEEQRPKSEDPDFWDVWTGKEPRKIDWEKIVKDWQSS